MTRSDVLKAADKCVNGQRQTDYGTPEDNFTIIAKHKIARIKSGNATEDSFVDLAGYAALWNDYLRGNFINDTDVFMMMAFCGGEIATKEDNVKEISNE